MQQVLQAESKLKAPAKRLHTGEGRPASDRLAKPKIHRKLFPLLPEEAAAFTAFGYGAPYTALTILKQTKDSSIPPPHEGKERIRRHSGHQLTHTKSKAGNSFTWKTPLKVNQEKNLCC